MNNTNSTSSGIGFVGALTLLFVGLKLAHVINWSWWWVLSPLWISWGVALVLVALVVMVREGRR